MGNDVDTMVILDFEMGYRRLFKPRHSTVTVISTSCEIPAAEQAADVLTESLSRIKYTPQHKSQTYPCQ